MKNAFPGAAGGSELRFTSLRVCTPSRAYKYFIKTGAVWHIQCACTYDTHALLLVRTRHDGGCRSKGVVSHFWLTFNLVRRDNRSTPVETKGITTGIHLVPTVVLVPLGFSAAITVAGGGGSGREKRANGQSAMGRITFRLTSLVSV